MEVTSYLLGKSAGGGGGDEPTGTINIVSNGTKNVKSYATANVNVQPNLQNKSVTVNTNGSTSVSADNNYDGLDTVSITTNVQPDLETKSVTITENGTTTLTPTSGKDGMSSVTVTTDVSGGSGGHDWSQIGYSSAPTSDTENFNESKYIYDNWNASATSAQAMFKQTISYQYEMPHHFTVFPNVDTSNLTNTKDMFKDNICLREISSAFDFSKITNAESMFQGCSSLQYVGDILPKNNCNIKNMFNSCTSLKNINRFRITNNANNTTVLHSINKLTVNHLLFYGNSAQGAVIQGISLLDIKEIVNEDGHTSRNKTTLANCTMTSGAIDEFLKYFKTLTNQGANYKTLKMMGFTSENCDIAVLSTHWQDLVTAGWTTGY